MLCYSGNEPNLSVIQLRISILITCHLIFFFSHWFVTSWNCFYSIDLQILSPRKGEAIEQDTDFGGMKHQYMILLENLDKGLSPVKLAKFLHGQTSILPRVYIFPTLSDESYARGAVVLNCGKNLDRLCGFLDNPHHVIVSSQGR